MQTTFTNRMNEHWIQTLDLASSEPLTKGWRQLETATNQINTGATRWQVIQLPTGSGKTEALKVLCAIQEPIPHPGILIITKFQDSADEIARGINVLAGRTVARSVHKNAPAEGIELGFVPVLVITHAAYRLALQELADVRESPKWERLRRYECGARSWLIIDEAFDWTDSYSVNLGDLRAMSGDLSGALPCDLRMIANRLQSLAISLTDIEQAGKSDRPLTIAHISALDRSELDRLQNTVSRLEDEVFAEWADTGESTDSPTDACTEKTLTSPKENYLNLLQALTAIARIGHGWISRRGGKVMLHSSRSLLGMDGMRGIILDATAEIDPAYSLMSEQLELLPRPQGIRCYRNATLHVSYGHKVGKDYLAQNAAKEWPIIWGSLEKRLTGKHVLVCAHNADRSFGQTSVSSA